MTDYIARIQTRYRLSLGKEFCKKHDLKEGDLLMMKEVQDGILVTPAKVVPKNQPEPEIITYDKYLNEIKPASESSAEDSPHTN